MIEVNTQATLLRLQKPLVNALVEIASTDYYRAIHNKIGVLYDFKEGTFPNYLRALLAEPKKMGTYHGAVFAPTLRIEGILFSQCSFLPKLPYDGEIFTGETNVGGVCGPQYQLHFAPAEGETCIYAWMGVKPKPKEEEKDDVAAEDPR